MALRPHLQNVALPVGKVLHEPGTRHRHMYFPRSGVVSLLYVMEDGTTGEVAMVGNEGLVGVSVLVESATGPTRGEVQIAGEALMLRADEVDSAFHSNDAFQLLVLRYTQLMLGHMAQAVICNRHHPVERQFAKWLALAFDRVQSDEIHLTQEAIARLLGVRREGVSRVARRMQDSGAIRYRRGHIRLLDRAMLVDHSCECYGELNRSYQRLIGCTPAVSHPMSDGARTEARRAL